jgi:hypothetical protein
MITGKRVLMVAARAGCLVAAWAAAWAATPVWAEAASLRQPYGLTLDGAGRLLVTCRGSDSIVVLSRSGEKLAELGTGQLRNPGGLCVLRDGRIAVASTGANEVAVLDAEGRPLGAIGGLAAPEDVAAGPDGLLYVADTGNSRIAVLDERQKAVVFTIEQSGDPPVRLKQPAGVAVGPDTLAVSDTGNNRLLVMRLPAKAADLGKAVAIVQAGMTPRLAAVGRDRRIYACGAREVFGFTAKGKSLGVFGAKAIRVTISYLFRPGGVAVDSSGNVLAVDRHTGRVFVTDADLTDPVPKVTLDAKWPATAVVEWVSPSPQPTLLDYGLTDDYGLKYEDAAARTKHRAVLKDLAPSACYSLRIRRPFEMVPESSEAQPGFALRHQKKYNSRLFEGSASRNETFATLPEKGKTDWASLPTIVLVYRNVRFPAKDGTQPPNRLLDDGDMAVLRSEMEKYRVWLWRQTACKLNLAFTEIVVDAERDHGLLGGLTREVFDDIGKGLAAQGKDVHDFWNVIVVGTHGWYANYLDGTAAGSDAELGSCYTAFGHGQKPGWYWFPVHEHGHLIHSMFMNSGLETLGFPDAPWTVPGRFGEDFSFMAANYRRQPPRVWLTLRTATIHTSADVNGNGVPDDDPQVPLDEKRFGWTAAMGGDCLKRLMAGIRTAGYPGGTDTDFDGKVHKLNEGELYWIDRRIPRVKPVLDGRLAEGEWKEFYSMPNLSTPEGLRALKARLYLAWDDGNYYFAVTSSRPVTAGLDLDGANDGWFHGRDNLRLSVRPAASGTTAEASGAVWDFLGNKMNVHDGQLWYRDAYKPGDIRAASGEQEGWYVLECAVPARAAIGIAPARKARFGLRARLWSDAADPRIPPTDFFDGEDFVYDLTCVP